MKKKKRPVLGYLPINTSLDNSINTNNSLNVSNIFKYRDLLLNSTFNTSTFNTGYFSDDKIFHG